MLHTTLVIAFTRFHKLKLKDVNTIDVIDKWTPPDAHHAAKLAMSCRHQVVTASYAIRWHVLHAAPRASASPDTPIANHTKVLRISWRMDQSARSVLSYCCAFLDQALCSTRVLLLRRSPAVPLSLMRGSAIPSHLRANTRSCRLASPPALLTRQAPGIGRRVPRSSHLRASPLRRLFSVVVRLRLSVTARGVVQHRRLRTSRRHHERVD
jgi:hypothetical protein